MIKQVDAAKIVFRGKFITLNIYIIKKESLKINDPSTQPKKLEVERQNKPNKIESK